MQEITTLVKKPLPLTKALINSTWSFYSDSGSLGSIIFNVDGTTGGNFITGEEKYWKYWKWNDNGGYLELIRDDKKTVNSKFLLQSIRDNGKWMLLGDWYNKVGWKTFLIEI